MSFNLRNRSLLALKDFSPRDIRYPLGLASELKRSKYAGTEKQGLSGKSIALIYEKESTRTRCIFGWAMHDQGGKFRRLLMRFERISVVHHALKTLAQTMINLRHFCRA
jgi:ornithine carbamoyltransferase